MRRDVLFLRTGVAIPVLYFGSIALAALFYPGFSFARQFASELGAEGAPHPEVLNVGLVLLGAVTMIATIGFWRVLPRLGARPVLARLTCYVLAMFAVAMLMAGIYPHPDLLHAGAGLVLAVLTGPALLAAALHDRADMRPLRRYLIVTNVLMVVMLVVYIGATRSAFVDLCQLVFSLLAIPWMGVSAYWLSRYPPTNAVGSEAVPAGPGAAPDPARMSAFQGV